MPPRNALPLPILILTTLALSGCASSVPAPTAALGGHGYVAGAEEVAEPPLHLLTIGTDGSVDQVDLLDESWAEIGGVNGTTHTATDGRFVFASDATGTVTIIDSGMWTRDHEDHFHYYRAAPRMVGTIEGTGPATVSAGSSATGVFFAASGDGVILDNAALADGEVVERVRVDGEPHDGSIVQLGLATLVTTSEDGTAFAVQARDGDGVVVSAAACAAAGIPITTAVGVAYPCADGALLVTTDGEDVRFERIPYPESSAPRATSFAAREGRPRVAGLAGNHGVWLLDTRERTFTLLPTAMPLLHVTAVDDADRHLVALTTDGRVAVLSADDGATLATTDPLLPDTLADADLLAGVALVADQKRAYLNAPAEQRLIEIDFADGARIARTFDTANMPQFFAETGR